jgi:DNA modification methylase
MTTQFEDLSKYLLDFTFSDANQERMGDFLEKSSESKTIIKEISIQNNSVKKYINEFWTSKQRQASSIHEVSYRACFKPQLPRFFINLLTKPNDVVYDPFSGRGTTIIEAALMNRNVIQNDINPLSKILTQPRLELPPMEEIKKRLDEIPFIDNLNADLDLSMFYDKKTESEIVSLKNYLFERNKSNSEDYIDRWIRMVATNRLTGHSAGFFSVYTLPPNQAVTPESQIKINQKRNQIPTYRNVKEIILNKSKSLLKDVTEEDRARLRKIAANSIFSTNDSRYTNIIPNNSVKLTVTSPPFLAVVQYSKDNWLRCWFNSIDVNEVSKNITMAKTVEKWSEVMDEVFKELYRITQHDGWVAFEVGEVNKGKIQLEEFVIPLGLKNGFECFGVLINLQEFTKTSNIWGINNNSSGTNTNRIAIFRKH